MIFLLSLSLSLSWVVGRGKEEGASQGGWDADGRLLVLEPSDGWTGMNLVTAVCASTEPLGPTVRCRGVPQYG
jgi:hypothetical protein